MSKNLSIRHIAINSFGTMISRITGILKQLTQNYLFGSAADPFNAAFRIMNTLRRYIGEGALSNSFIPILQKMASEDKSKADRFTSNIINIFLLVNIILTSLGMLLSPLYFPFLVIGFKPGTPFYTQAIYLNIIMFPFVIFISLFAVCMGYLNSNKRFASPAFAPVFFNIIYILMPILLYKKLGIYSLGLSVLCGGFFMAIFVFADMFRSGYKYSFVIDFKDPALKDFFKLFIPASGNMLFLTFKNLITTQFLSFFIGGMTVFMNVFILVEAPIGIIGIAIGTVLLPAISKFKAENNTEMYNKSIFEAFYLLYYLIIPVCIFFIAFPQEVVHSLYRDLYIILLNNTGKYTDLYDMTVKTLRLVSIGLIPMASISLYERIFYSLKNSRIILKANIIILVLSGGFYFTSLIPHVGYYGVIIADVIAVWMTVFYYRKSLDKQINFKEILKPLNLDLFKILASGILALFIIYPLHIFVYKSLKGGILTLLFSGFEFFCFCAIYYIVGRIIKLKSPFQRKSIIKKAL